MNNKNGFVITHRDYVLRAWLNSTELVRDYQAYAQEIGNEDKNLAQCFAEYAETEAEHAAKFRQLLLNYEQKKM